MQKHHGSSAHQDFTASHLVHTLPLMMQGKISFVYARHIRHENRIRLAARGLEVTFPSNRGP